MVSATPLLCTLAPRGATPALDLVPSLGTTPLSLVRLARALEPARVVRAYAYRGIDEDAPPHATIEAIAQANVAELVRAAPHGPYLIAGHCLGGAVAFAMAAALEARGERVAALVVIDAMPPIAAAHRDAIPIPDTPAAGAMVAQFGQVLRSLGVRAVETHGQLDDAIARRLDTVLKRHLDAAVAYRARPLRAPLHVLRTAESEAAIESEWAQYTPALTRHTVPGDTLSMLKPPHVDAVGRVLGRLLAGAP